MSLLANHAARPMSLSRVQIVETSPALVAVVRRLLRSFHSLAMTRQVVIFCRSGFSREYYDSGKVAFLVAAAAERLSRLFQALAKMVNLGHLRNLARHCEERSDEAISSAKAMGQELRPPHWWMMNPMLAPPQAVSLYS